MCSPSTLSSSVHTYRSACITLLIAAAAAAPASAQAVLVDFEQLTSAPCTFAMTNALHDELASQGVHFSGPTLIDRGAVLDQCGNFFVGPHGGSKFLTFNTSPGAFLNGGSPMGPETVRFDQRSTSVDIWVASGNSGDTCQIQAFDGSTQVGSNTIACGPFWSLISVSVAGGFDRIVLDVTDTLFVYDDMSFTPQAGAPATLYCFGDGSGTACPCANNSPVGGLAGCLSSLGIGGQLSATGSASIASDTIVLAGAQMSNSSVLYFQGTTRTASGSGTVFGDGLRCAGGTVIRLKSTVNVSGMSHYPGLGDTHVSVHGGVTAPGTRTYQAWYRNAAAFCTPTTFNLTNGVELTWTP